jgi:hypothetical protein
MAPLVATSSCPLWVRWMVVMRLRAESNGTSATRGSSVWSWSRSRPALAARASRAPSVGSPATSQACPAEVGGSRWASLASTAASSSRPSGGAVGSTRLPSLVVKVPWGA